MTMLFLKLRRLVEKSVHLRVAIVVTLLKIVGLPLAFLDAVVAYDVAARLGLLTSPLTSSAPARSVLWTFLVASAIQFSLVVMAWWQLMYGRSLPRRVVGGGVIFALSVSTLLMLGAALSALGSLSTFGSTSQDARWTWGDTAMSVGSLLWILFVLLVPAPTIASIGSQRTR